MDRAVEQYFSSGLAEATKKTYQAGQKHYLSFCENSATPPYPVSEEALCRFAAVLAGKGIAHNTIKVYISATRQLQISKGLPDPRVEGMAKLAQVLKGVRSSSTGFSKFVRLPITPKILSRIKQTWEAEGLNNDRTMVWAAMLLCFFGFFRSGEICAPSPGLFDANVHLSFADITVVVDSTGNPKQLQVRLKRSKTDQLGEGTTVCVGKTGEELCPVAATLSWMVKRGNAGGPLFHYADGAPLTQQRFVVEVRKALLSIGEDPQRYGGHSFRIGAATIAAEQGVGDATIKLLGRWRSSAYQRYIKILPTNLASYSQRLLKSPPTAVSEQT